MKIYRIEHPNTKLGMWQHSNIAGNEQMRLSREYCIIDDRAFDEYESHPSPNEEFDGFEYNPFQKCACVDIQQVHHWFEKHWYGLQDRFGFKLYEIEIKEQYVMIGKHQVVYNENFVVSKREITKEEFEKMLNGI